MRITTEIEGREQLVVAQARGVQGLKESMRKLVLEAAEAAKAEMLAGVPRSGTSNPEGSIADSIDVQSTAFDPGGAGGGGFWRTAVGPGPDAPQHLKFVLGGTGVHLPEGRGLFGPTNKQVLKFSNGYFSAFSSGQEANREWLVRAHQVAQEVIRVGQHNLDFNS